jgi:hypothetical protein
MRWPLVLAVLWAVAACGGAEVAPVPSPASGHLLAVAERADDALRVAYGSGEAAPLQGALGGRALMLAQKRLSQFSASGIRREELLDSRREVHESAAGTHAEVVLQIRARQRIVHPGTPVPPYATVLRQWRATLALQNGRWVVVDDGDLPPAQWWPQ